MRLEKYLLICLVVLLRLPMPEMLDVDHQQERILKEYIKGDIQIPEYDPEELKRVSVGAGVLLGGMGGA